MVNPELPSPAASLARLAKSRSTMLLARRALVVLIPALAFFFMLQALWSFTMPPDSSSSSSDSSYHIAIHGNSAYESKYPAIKHLLQSLNPSQGPEGTSIVDSIKQGLVYRVSSPLTVWRNRRYTFNPETPLSRYVPDVAIPLVPERPAVYAYFDLADPSLSKRDEPSSETNHKGNQNHHVESQILETWKRAWYAIGFKPVVLTQKDAKEHYMYQSIEKALEGRDDLKKILLKNYGKWFAYASKEKGILADHRVFPLSRNYDHPTFVKLRENDFDESLALFKTDLSLVISNPTGFRTLLDLVNRSFTRQVDGPDVEKKKEEKKSSENKNTKRDFKESGSKESLFSDLNAEIDRLFEVYVHPSNENPFGLYSDAHIDLITSGHYPKDSSDPTKVDPSYVLTLINIHLHQIFLGAYPNGISYVDPINGIPLRKINRKSLSSLAEVYPPILESGKPSPEKTWALASPARSIAEDLAQCPSLEKYDPYLNVCPPTSETLSKIDQLNKDFGSKSAGRLKISIEQACTPLPCSEVYERKHNKKTSTSSTAAILADHLPDPLQSKVYSVASFVHPVFLLYAAMQDPEALPTLDFVRYHMTRDGLVQGLTSGGIFAHVPHINPEYRTIYLKDSIFEPSAKTNVSWIPYEGTPEKIGQLLEWELGFRPLGSVGEEGNHLTSFEEIIAKTQKESLGQEQFEYLVNLLKISATDFETYHRTGRRPLRSIEHALVKQTEKGEKANEEERLALLDSINLWSPNDYEIWSFLRVWTLKKYKDLVSLQKQ
ncbi:uncharacterized protein SAPINGB_P001837 [Magnusiomyces paraingens]|uniref:Uncharacterized protein n=1 Tax=Magnusiomyces paraingens TaxID=2606893 RepID=A0A5E8BCX0_9ASCO|nr:uncharacterized protein SAPINGB_P001837 [Saprochaete ingens]VVT48557.1 unnamed protein product [Saprochaete ingens]